MVYMAIMIILAYGAITASNKISEKFPKKEETVRKTDEDEIK